MQLIIVIATYNSDNTLKQCLDSILMQTYNNYLIYIKDGGSTDNTLAIIKKYQKAHHNINLLSSCDSGVYDAWNIVIRLFGDGWVTFLGSDDYFKEQDSLAKIVSEIDSAEMLGARIIYGRNLVVDQYGSIVEEVGDGWDIARKGIYHEMTIRHPGCFCHSSLLRELNGFDDSFRIIGDYDFILRAINFSSVYFYDFSAVCHRIGGLSISPSRCMRVIKETYKLRKKHNLKPFLYMNAIFFKRLTLFFLSKILSDAKILNLIRRLKKR